MRFFTENYRKRVTKMLTHPVTCDKTRSQLSIFGQFLYSPRLATDWTVRDRIPVEARFSATVHTGPGALPASCTMGNGYFPGIKSDRGVRLTTHSLLVPWSRKSRAISLLPYRPYGFYRASVPVQGCILPLHFYSYTRLFV